MCLLLFIFSIIIFNHSIITFAFILPLSLYPKEIARSHSFQDGFLFESRDGWHSVNIIGLEDRQPTNNHTADIQHLEIKSSTLSVAGTVSHLVDTVWDDLKGLGSPENVTITWSVKR